MSATLPAASRAATVSAPKHASTPASDPVLEWNRFLLGIQATPGDQLATVHPTYDLAVMHAAIYDAIVSIDHSAQPYLTTVHGPRSASTAAAADAAAHDTLVAMYPSLRPSIDKEYAGLLSQLPAGRHESQGIRVGEMVAAQILARRPNDGSTAPLIPLQPGTGPGDYQLTSPAFAQAVFTHWRFVRPFALTEADQFRPPAPPALTSPKYAAAINEVKTLGEVQGSTRTPDQTQIGLFWNPPIWATWNRIAQSAVLGHNGTLSQEARTFAALNLTFADSVIAFYNAKYTYRLWRPVTAIRNADTDGNPDTAADPNWTPLSATAPDPSYPGARHDQRRRRHGAVVDLRHRLRVHRDVARAARRRAIVRQLSEAAEEASVSRIYNGNHTRIDQVAGEDLGHDIAGFVLQNDLVPHGAHTR